MAADLKRRVETRLAWLGLVHRDFADIIGMDKSSLSRALRAEQPRGKTLRRIATGLGMTQEQLLESKERAPLLMPHPALVEASEASKGQKKLLLKEWFSENWVEEGD